jgi:hypothetical protein
VFSRNTAYLLVMLSNALKIPQGITLTGFLKTRRGLLLIAKWLLED